MFRLRIKELAAERGWTLKQVAEQSELSYSTVELPPMPENRSTNINRD